MFGVRGLVLAAALLAGFATARANPSNGTPGEAYRVATAMGLGAPVVAARRFLHERKLDGNLPRTWIVAPGGRVLAEQIGYDRRQRRAWIDAALAELKRLKPAASAQRPADPP